MTRLSQQTTASPLSSSFTRSSPAKSTPASPTKRSASLTSPPEDVTPPNNNAPADLLANLDFTSITEMDPSLVDGYRVVYDREVSFEVRIQEQVDGPQQVGSLEAFKVKILVLGEEEDPQAVRLELASEADLFFHYVHDLDENGFALVQEQQKLMVEFVEYPNILIKMMNSAINDPATHLAIFILLPDSSARVDFIQNLEYKYVDVLSCQFAKSAEDIVQQHITYRYNALRGRLALMQARLQDISHLIKHKSPGLLLQLQKGSSILVTNNANFTPSYASSKAAMASAASRAAESY